MSFCCVCICKKFAWHSGMGNGNQGKTKHISVSRQRTDSTHTRLALSAGVQTMRARICSAFSCDVFARVAVRCCWERETNDLHHQSVSHTLATHYFLRLTRARRPRFGRRTARVLLADFWYFSSLKSTIREKFIYDTFLLEFFSRANDIRPY